jgi:hypothetical protein
LQPRVILLSRTFRLICSGKRSRHSSARIRPSSQSAWPDAAYRDIGPHVETRRSLDERISALYSSRDASPVGRHIVGDQPRRSGAHICPSLIGHFR